MIRFFPFLFVVGCGSSFLESGTYHVRTEYVRDDWPNSLVGQVFESEWEITEKNDFQYRVQRGLFDMVGTVENSLIVFFRAGEKKKHCDSPETVYQMELSPDDTGKSFVGFASLDTVYCTSEQDKTILITEIGLKGTIK